MAKSIRTEIKEILQNIFPDEKIIIDSVPVTKRGDYSTNLAMKIATRLKTSATGIAEEIKSKIKNPAIAEMVIYEPGFINFVLNPEYLLAKLAEDAEPKLELGRGIRMNVEFVSVNPTGPINIVNARAAVFGDSLVKLLNYAGYNADSEYYINDTGRQIDLLAESIIQRMNELQGKKCQIPDNGYHGEYIIELAKEILKEKIEDFEAIKKYAVDYFVSQQKRTLERFGVVFKNWIPESKIRSEGYIERIIDFFKSKNLCFLKDGALYLKTTLFGDTRDRVLITSDNRYTYLLPDIAYHQNKIERGYEKLITILGPDHLGQTKSLQGALVALGYPADMLKIIIVQEVKLKKEGRFLSMSKRAGTFWALDDLLKKIPVDVVRFFLMMRSCSQHLDFDLDLALQESEENPVYYVQYAYARIRNIVRFAEEKGIKMEEKPDLSLIREKEEFDLIKQTLKFPEVIEDAVRDLDPFSLTHYLISLSRNFHYFYQKHRVVGEDEKLTQARLFMVSRTARTIKTGLALLGCSCPERM
uniref:Arginine--tRNA ligase n=1 Tax=candidate division WOR-3 bacterium TaxID=2052148 RepID=A0A7C4X8Y6_UNCW3